MKATIAGLFLVLVGCLSFAAEANAQTAGTAKRKCVGPCTAGTCPAGYTLGSTSCNCNASCECAGNTTCVQAGGGTVAGGACNGGCSWVFVSPEIEDPIAETQKSWGPRVKKGCTLVF